VVEQRYTSDEPQLGSILEGKSELPGHKVSDYVQDVNCFRLRKLTQCHSLAYLELNMTIAVIFRPGGPRLELFETDESDIVQEHDYLIPLPKFSSKGLRVKVV
jgi:hypothetical protein